MRGGMTADPAAAAREAREDFELRTLCYVPGGLGQLVYLSSCRDCNSGQYRHDGLAVRYAPEAVHQGLLLCHRELFAEWVKAPLERWVQELRAYFTNMDAGTIRVWKQLRPYHIVIPLSTTPLAAELFHSNLKIALEVLETEQRQQTVGSATHAG